MRKQKDPSATSFLGNLRVLMRGYRVAWRLSPTYFGCTLGTACITALQPMSVLFFSARILNELAGARSVQTIMTYAAATVLLGFALAAVKAFLKREQENTGDYMAYLLIQSMEAKRFARIDFPHAEDSRISEMLADMDTKARGNALGILNLFYQTQVVAGAVFSLAFSAALLGGMFSSNSGYEQSFVTSPFAAVALVFGMALCIVLSLLYHQKEKHVMERVFSENAMANNSASYYNKYVQADQGAKDIRLYAQRKALASIFRSAFNGKAWHSFFNFEGRLNGFEAAMLALFSGGVYLVIGLRALAGMYEVGDVLRYVGAVNALGGALGTLAATLGQWYNNALFVKPMLEFLDLPDRLEKGTTAIPPAKENGYEFEFRSVSFRYPGSEAYALKDLNMKITPNQRLAVVGLNGSGKTTMIKLLCRLYDPSEGEILLDGVNIKQYDYDAYHALFSVVFQDFALMPLKLGENVAGSADYDAKKVRDCLTGAGFDERLSRMPEGLDAYVYKSFDEEGVQLSGGEAQKVALARALYKDAPFVVLDEPTAALDPIAEFEVYSTFEKTIGKKTAVFISHRLSSCRFCHDIAVFDAGRLVQRGSHESLLAKRDGRYYELWNAQARHYVDEPAG